MHENDGTIAKMLVAGNGMYNRVAAVIFPVVGIGIGYSFRWKRNVEKRDGCGILKNLYIRRKQVAKTGEKLIYYKRAVVEEL